MKKLYYFFVNSGKIVFVWTLLLTTSVSLYSLTIKGKVNYGGRCYQNFDDSIIRNMNYKNVKFENGYLACNTYYLEYTSTLSEDNNVIFLVSLSKLLSDNNIDCNIHVVIKNEEYQILSTIVDYQVSYTKTLV